MDKYNLETKIMPLSELHSAEYNPRQISDSALQGLENSIERFGLVQPIVWNKQTGNVVGGHQRIKALQKMGKTEAPVIVVDLSEPEEKALNVTMNNPAIQGEFTGDLSILLDEIKIDMPELDFSALNMDDLGLTKILNDDDNSTARDRKELTMSSDYQYSVIIDCDDETHQAELLNELEGRGLKCRLMTF